MDSVSSDQYAKIEEPEFAMLRQVARDRQSTTVIEASGHVDIAHFHAEQ